MNGESLPGGRLPTLRPDRTARPQPVKHGGVCGVRIPAPHPECQALFGPNYNGGELRTTTFSGDPRIHVMWVICHGCGSVTRSETAA